MLYLYNVFNYSSFTPLTECATSSDISEMVPAIAYSLYYQNIAYNFGWRQAISLQCVHLNAIWMQRMGNVSSTIVLLLTLSMAEQLNKKIVLSILFI